ncbi:MAG: hypothetical protein EON90_08315 [Brevundimonas sp.]|nr:MAG: hypothetical protein EON90_08315 [Brevundimonas sp.]
MLSLLLVLLQDPATLTGPVPPPAPQVRLRVIDGDGMTVLSCNLNGFQRIERPAGGAPELRPDLTYRQDDEVRHYLLLDRTIRGCPAPISYALPNRQDGFIRELGRTPPPVRVQPPRSSE